MTKPSEKLVFYARKVGNHLRDIFLTLTQLPIRAYEEIQETGWARGIFQFMWGFITMILLFGVLGVTSDVLRTCENDRVVSLSDMHAEQGVFLTEGDLTTEHEYVPIIEMFVRHDGREFKVRGQRDVHLDMSYETYYKSIQCKYTLNADKTKKSWNYFAENWQAYMRLFI